MSETLKKVVQLLLEDDEIKSALLELMRGAATSLYSEPRESWDEVWRQISTDTRKLSFKSKFATDKYVLRDSHLQIVAYHNLKAKVGKIEATAYDKLTEEDLYKLKTAATPSLSNPFSRSREEDYNIEVLNTAFYAETYSEVIVRAQQWWEEAVAAWEKLAETEAQPE